MYCILPKNVICKYLFLTYFVAFNLILCMFGIIAYIELHPFNLPCEAENIDKALNIYVYLIIVCVTSFPFNVLNIIFSCYEPKRWNIVVKCIYLIFQLTWSLVGVFVILDDNIECLKQMSKSTIFVLSMWCLYVFDMLFNFINLTYFILTRKFLEEDESKKYYNTIFNLD